MTLVRRVGPAVGRRVGGVVVLADVFGPDARPRHNQGASRVAGPWFLGLPWQRTRGSSWLGFVHRDATDIAARMFTHEDAHA